MFLSQEDVEAVSANATAATTVLRQLDMELVSVKRQVRAARSAQGASQPVLRGRWSILPKWVSSSHKSQKGVSFPRNGTEGLRY